MNSRPSLSRPARVAAPALACLAVLAVASPASAGRPDSSTNVRSGERATVSWTELDPANLLGAPGNTHVGNLSVEDGVFGSFAHGFIDDFQCEAGQAPGGHGNPGTCTPKGTRFLEALGGGLTVTDRTATFTGIVTVSNGGHGDPGSVLAQVPASITWTSNGDTVRFRETFTIVDGKISYRSRVSGTRSDATTTVVGGALGRMGFADDADDVSVGEFRTFTEVSRERIR